MSTEVIAAFERFKKTLEAARDCHRSEEIETSRHLRGLTDGLNLAIGGIDAEIRWLQATTPITQQGEQET